LSNNLRLIYAAAHAGYDPRTAPLGGAATICERLVKKWGNRPDIKLTLIGPGQGLHYKGFEYIKLPGDAPDLTRLSELKYADFSVRFEYFVAATVEDIIRADGVQNTCFIGNDISEAGDFVRIHRTGAPILTLYHVDVVEFFSKMYLRNVLPPERLAAFFDGALKGPFRGWIPSLLGLVFKKQRESLLYSQGVIVPSENMKAVLRRCYPWVPPDRIHVFPWGGSQERFPELEIQAEAQRLRGFYGVRTEDTVLMTLSRISPEKGIDLLLEALILWERESRPPHPLVGNEGVIHLFICGEAAYMGGERHKKKLIRLAGRLKRVKVHFPGYVAGPAKAGFFELADLYVFPSRHDSYGLTLVEAMQVGLPVLTSSHHSANDLIREEWGRVVRWSRESEAPRVLLGALKSLLADPARLAEMGRQAMMASRHWDFSSAAERILDLARNCIVNPCPAIPNDTPDRA
jgi:glycosyltransferase involved in cell wall biosynthesis